MAVAQFTAFFAVFGVPAAFLLAGLSMVDNGAPAFSVFMCAGGAAVLVLVIALLLVLFYC